jgi:hypothetical protein
MCCACVSVRNRRLKQRFDIPEDQEGLDSLFNQSISSIPELQGFIVQTNTTVRFH